MQRKKRQHYVPQFHLKNFSLEKKVKKKKEYYIHFFDKTSEINDIANIRNKAQEKYFYDINNDQKIENSLEKIESEVSKVYRGILSNEDISLLEIPRTRGLMSLFLAIQFIRTKYNRELSGTIIKKIRKFLYEKYGQIGNDLEKYLNNAISKEDMEKSHLNQFSPNNIFNFSKMFLLKKWILLVNKTDIPFWTSDNPIVPLNPFNSYPYGNGGVISSGTKLYFPISTELCLCLLDPEIYRSYIRLERIDPYYTLLNVMKAEKYLITDISHVLFQNSLQVKGSFREFYSKNSDFGLAKEMIKKDPKLKNLENRVKIELLKMPDGREIIHTKNIMP